MRAYNLKKFFEGVFLMIQVFFNNRGSGKTKALINLANEKAYCCKGNVVYIDDDERPLLELDRKIRVISTKNFKLSDYNSFYGFLCGILSEDYDIDTIFIDGLSNINNSPTLLARSISKSLLSVSILSARPCLSIDGLISNAGDNLHPSPVRIKP